MQNDINDEINLVFKKIIIPFFKPDSAWKITRFLSPNMASSPLATNPKLSSTLLYAKPLPLQALLHANRKMLIPSTETI